VKLISPVVEWECPACGRTDQTRDPRPHTRMHVCPKTRYLTTPMVRAGTKARIVLKEREDYVGTEKVQLDPERGRPVMSLITERADGSNDVRVYAPTASADAK
jgi:hypothetical protein